MNAKRTRNYYDMFAIMFNNSKILPKIYRKYPFGPLNGNTRVLLRLIKTPNIHIFKMAAPTEDHFPQTIL